LPHNSVLLQTWVPANLARTLDERARRSERSRAAELRVVLRDVLNDDEGASQGTPVDPRIGVREHVSPA
jgi:hypothetical protein